MNTSYQIHINIHVCVGFLPARGSMVISLKEQSEEPSSGLPASQLLCLQVCLVFPVLLGRRKQSHTFYIWHCRARALVTLHFPSNIYVTFPGTPWLLADYRQAEWPPLTLCWGERQSYSAGSSIHGCTADWLAHSLSWLWHDRWLLWPQRGGTLNGRWHGWRASTSWSFPHRHLK